MKNGKEFNTIFLNEAEHIDLRCPLPPMNISCDFAAGNDLKSILIIGGASGGKSKEVKRMIAEQQAKGFNVHVVTQEQFNGIYKRNRSVMDFNPDPIDWLEPVVHDIKADKIQAQENKQRILRQSNSLLNQLKEVPKKPSGTNKPPKKKKRK